MIKLEVGKYYLNSNNYIIKVLSKENGRFKTTAGTYDEEGNFSFSNDGSLIEELPNFDGEVQLKHHGIWKDVKVGIVKEKVIGVYLDVEHLWVSHNQLRNKPRTYTKKYWVILCKDGFVYVAFTEKERDRLIKLDGFHDVLEKEERWEM